MKRKMKKLACAATLALTVCACHAFTGINGVYANTQNAGFTTVSVSNASFDSNPTSSYLDTSPTGWSSDNNTSKKGIINVDNLKNSFDYNCVSSYHLQSTENPSKVGDDNKVLMVNARKDSATDISKSTVDGFTSNEITLEANSYYRLSVWVNTISDAHASIVLQGLNEQNMLTETTNAYFSDIQTSLNCNEWQEYSFYIQTNQDSQSVKLKLALGIITESNQFPSFGAVFFDEVELIKCSESYYENLKANENTGLENFKEIRYNKFDATPDINFDFEDGLQHWEQFGTYSNDAVFTATTKTTSNIAEGSDFSANNKKALVISADKNNAVHVGFKSEKFTIKMGNIYRISVMAKTTDLVGTATINLVESDYLETQYNSKHTPTTSTLTFSSTAANQLTNDYKEYIFYVSGYELYDTEAYLELVLGEQNVPAYGTVVFDSIKISNISYSQFSALSDSSDNYKKVTLSTISATPSFANAGFNSAHSENALVEYPLTPSDWTQTTSENSTVFGVVNTTKWDEIPATKKPTNASPLNPSIEAVDGTIISVPATASNNILMIYNKPFSNQVITSPNFTANTNTYYKLSFNYYTYGDCLTIKVLDADQNAVYTDENIASTTAWSNYNIFFKTEHFAVETLTIVFELNNKELNKNAYVFLDNFQFYTPTSFTAENFQSAIDTGLNTIDLSNLGIHQTGNKNPNTDVYEAPMFTGNLVSGTQTENSDPIAFGGIIDEDNSYGIEFPSTHTNAVNNMIMLKTLGIADYTLTSKNKISLSASSYYKFSVYIKTSFNEAAVNDQKYGAYFKLDGVTDAQISKIASGTMFDQYIIYVSTQNATSVAIQFGLCSESTTNHTALFDTFEFASIDKTTFQNAVNSNNVLVLNNITEEAEEEPEDTTTTQTGYGGNLWIELSTILMIAAIVIAVVGGLLRKTKLKKFKAKKHTEYVQRASMVRDASMVEAEKRRNQEIKNLLQEKQELANYLKDLEQANKQRLAENRRTSGKAITRKAEKEFKLYASKRQKIVRDMSRIDERIKDAQTPEYVARIAKIIQSEKVKAMEQADQAGQGQAGQGQVGQEQAGQQINQSETPEKTNHTTSTSAPQSAPKYDIWADNWEDNAESKTENKQETENPDDKQ